MLLLFWRDEDFPTRTDTTYVDTFDGGSDREGSAVVVGHSVRYTSTPDTPRQTEYVPKRNL